MSRVHRASRTLPIGERLKAHGYIVNENGCWIWQGDKTYRGYGRMSVGNKSRSTHRLAYEAWVGPIPEGMLIRHTCDTPLCINPEHLIPGTPKDNMQDKYSRGRANMPKGDEHYEELVHLREELRLAKSEYDIALNELNITKAKTLRALENQVDFQLKIHKLKSDKYEAMARMTPDIYDPELVHLREELRLAKSEYDIALNELNIFAKTNFKEKDLQ